MKGLHVNRTSTLALICGVVLGIGLLLYSTQAQQVGSQGRVVEVEVGATPRFFVAPIGSIIAWHKSFPNTPPLPVGWVECNGQILNDQRSPYDGQVIPALNGSARFLRGGTTSGTVESDLLRAHTHDTGTYQNVSTGDHDHSVTTTVNSTDLGSHDHGASATASTSISEPDGPHNHGLAGVSGAPGSVAGIQFNLPGQSTSERRTTDAGYHRHSANTSVSVSVSATGVGSHAHSTSTSEATSGDHTHHIIGDSGNTGGSETRPSNMSVVWIMRVR